LNARAALFDVDGTLLDSNELHVKAWRRAFADFDIHISTQQLRGQMGNGGDRVVKALCSPDQAESLGKELIQRHVDIFTRDYLHRVRPFPCVRDLFQRLRDDGVRIVLASSAQQWERDRHIEILGIGHLLDGATTGDEIDHTKPRPDIFHLALRGLPDVSPRQAVVVGDSPYDAQAGRRAGMQVVGVLSGGFEKRVLWDAGARMVFRDLEDLLESYDASPFAQDPIVSKEPRMEGRPKRAAPRFPATKGRAFRPA